MALYRPPTRVVTSELPYQGLVAQADPGWARDKFWAVEYQADGHIFEANPYVRGAYNRLSNTYPVGTAYGGLDPLVEAGLAPTIGNPDPGLYSEVPQPPLPPPYVPPAPMAPPVLINAATQGNFAAYNVFDGQFGPYWTMLNAWNTGALVPGVDYNDSINNFPLNFPKGTVFAWQFPAIPNGGNVFAFPEIVYGTQGPSGFIGYPANAPTPMQLSSFARLALTYNFTKNFGTDDADCIFETWAAPLPDRSLNPACEFIIYAYAPFANSSQVLSFPNQINYSVNGFNAVIGTPDLTFTYIAVLPVTGPGSTTPLDTSIGTHTVEITPIIQTLITAGWLNPADWLTGYEFGFEVAKNSGGATVNKLVWTWQ